MSKIQRSILCMTGVLLGLLCPSAAFPGTNATKFLNQSLITKPAIKRHRTVVTTRQECTKSKNAGDPSEVSFDCVDIEKSHTQKYSEAPQVKSSFVTEVRNLKFHEDKIISIPGSPLLVRKIYQNCADDTIVSGSVSLSVTGTEGYSVTKTKAVSTSISGSATLSGQFTPLGVGGSASTTFSMSRVVTLSDAETESHSESTTRSETWTVTIAKKTMGMFEMLAYQSTIDLPFSATVVVDGTLQANDSRIKNASDLLTEAERTLPFEGVVRMTNVSEGSFRTLQFPGSPKCDQTAGLLTTESEEFTLPPAAKIGGNYSKSQDFHTTLKLKQNFISLEDGGPTIGPADGVTYQVMGSYPVTQPDAQCGFNSLSIPKPAEYRAELRSYTHYVGGTLIRQWAETVFVFDHCQG